MWPFKNCGTNQYIGNKGYYFLEKDKDIILIDYILGILLEDIFRQLILQRIRIKDSLRIFKDKDKDFLAIWEIYVESNMSFGSIHQNFVLVRHIAFCSQLLSLLTSSSVMWTFFFYLTLTFFYIKVTIFCFWLVIILVIYW